METWLDGQLSELVVSCLQKLEFGRCSFFLFFVGLRTYQHPFKIKSVVASFSVIFPYKESNWEYRIKMLFIACVLESLLLKCFKQMVEFQDSHIESYGTGSHLNVISV